MSIGYYDQEQAKLTSNKTVLQELWDSHPTTAEKDIRSILGSFLFSGNDVEKTVPQLSGGEKARLALAKLAMDKENFLILDEPTNHLDIDSKEVLENALIDYEGTLLFVSHDRYFINRIATKVVELSETGSQLYLGDYDYYLEKKAEEHSLQPQGSTEQTLSEPSGKTSFQQSKEAQRQIRSYQRAVAKVETELQEVEEKLAQLEVEMGKPVYSNDPGALMDFQKEVTTLEEKQEALLIDWEEASLALESFSE